MRMDDDEIDVSIGQVEALVCNSYRGGESARRYALHWARLRRSLAAERCDTPNARRGSVVAEPVSDLGIFGGEALC